MAAKTKKNKPKSMLEREVKLAVDDSFTMPELQGVVPGACLGPVEERSIRDVYWDTNDLRLARWGCTLRFRDGDGWTAKIPAPSSGRVFRRHEITFTAPPDRPPPRVLALVRSLTRGEPVAEVARFTTTRLARTWQDTDGNDVVELVDDRVSAVEPDGESVAWRELEVELAPDAAEKILAKIIDRLEEAGAQAGSTVPKLVQALGDPAMAPPDVIEPDLPKKPTGRQVIQTAFSRSVIHLILHLPAARVGQDIEGVHQARVATRRLRSDLRTFRPLLDPQWAHRLEEELRWLADDLGAVRDADVLLARLPKVVDKYPELDSEGADRVIKGMEQRRRASNRILLSHLNRRATDHLLDLLVEAAANPMTRPKADDPAVDRLSVLVRKRWRRVQRAVDALALEPPIDDLHRIRILAKRARYAAEAVGPVFDPKAKSFAKSMAGIQDVLGELNDAAVAEVMLAKMAETASGPAAFTAGRMTQMITSDGAQFRHGWEKYYRRASRKKSQDWLR